MMASWKYSEGWPTWAKRVFSKCYTYFPVLQSKPIKKFDKVTTIHNTHQTKRETHSNFHIFEFRVLFNLYTRLFTKLNLWNFTIHYIYYNESFQIYGNYKQYNTFMKKFWWGKFLANLTDLLIGKENLVNIVKAINVPIQFSHIC